MAQMAGRFDRRTMTEDAALLLPGKHRPIHGIAPSSAFPLISAAAPSDEIARSMVCTSAAFSMTYCQARQWA